MYVLKCVYATGLVYGANPLFTVASENQTGVGRGKRGDPKKVRFNHSLFVPPLSSLPLCFYHLLRLHSVPKSLYT